MTFALAFDRPTAMPLLVHRNAVVAAGVLVVHAAALWALQSGLVHRQTPIVETPAIVVELLAPPVKMPEAITAPEIPILKPTPTPTPIPKPAPVPTPPPILPKPAAQLEAKPTPVAPPRPKPLPSLPIKSPLAKPEVTPERPLTHHEPLTKPLPQAAPTPQPARPKVQHEFAPPRQASDENTSPPREATPQITPAPAPVSTPPPAPAAQALPTQAAPTVKAKPVVEPDTETPTLPKPPLKAPPPAVASVATSTGKVTRPSTGAAYASNPKPAYPPMSKRLGEQGTVRVNVHVGENGEALDVKIAQSSGFERLDKAALDAVRRWRFKPGTRDGVPQAAWFVVPMPFKLEGTSSPETEETNEE